MEYDTPNIFTHTQIANNRLEAKINHQRRTARKQLPEQGYDTQITPCTAVLRVRCVTAKLGNVDCSSDSREGRMV